MLWSAILPALLLLLVACSDDASPGSPDTGVDVGVDSSMDAIDDAVEDTGVVREFCSGPGAQIYDPLVREEVDLWPDALWSTDDAASPTGERLVVDGAPWVPGIPFILEKTMTGDLNAVLGFGAHGAIFFRFDTELGEFPELDEEATDDRIWLVDLDASPPARIPFEARVLEDDPTIILQPLLPLANGHRHVAVVTTAQTDIDGGCLAPSSVTRRVLEGNAGDDLGVLATQWSDALTALELDPTDVSAITTFRVHDEPATFGAIAETIPDLDLAWEDTRDCETTDEWIRCELYFASSDFRGEDRGIRDAESADSYLLPVTAWFPVDADGPVPLTVYGHGLNGRRGDASAVARRLVPEGFAVVSTDALEHGDHPSFGDPSVELDALRFLGVSFDPIAFDGGVLQGNFMQTVLDRLQLIELVRRSPDLDGDGTDDVDPDRITYWGISLGGLLGSGTMALSPDIDAGVLSIGGGHLVVFVTDTANAAPFVPLFARLAGGDAAFERWLVMAQTAIDSADPSTWGAHILRDRIIGEVPDTLFPVTIYDDTVPPRTGWSLARALGAPHLNPVYVDVSQLDTADGPVSANLPSGRTGAYVQFDQITRGGGELEDSSHGNLPFSDEGEAQALHFFRTWRDTGTAEIIVPALPER